MGQALRDFIAKMESERPDEVLHIHDEIDPKYEVSGLMLEAERHGHYPLFLFDHIKGFDIPVVTGVISHRKRFADALGVPLAQATQTFMQRSVNRFAPTEIDKAPFHANVQIGSQVDLTKLPILTHFPVDPAPYITAAMVVTRDPKSGTDTLGYHRCMLKGKNRLGISLHSRRRVWEYQLRAEELKQDLPAAICIGLHPIHSLASMALLPYDESKFELIGGLFGEPMEVARCATIDLLVPAWTEIVLEGRILSSVREPEGPFSEFTGYASSRSTQNVFLVEAVSYRDEPLYQSICSGFAGDHNTVMGFTREVDVIEAVRRTVPNVKAVHVPISGCGIFHCYISIKKTAEGQPQQAIYAAFGIDHGCKLVIVVDDDVDVFNEKDVLWSLSTRMQGDRSIMVMPRSMGVILDPSTTEQGVTTKVGIDSTRPLGPYAQRLELSVDTRAKAVILWEKVKTEMKG
ncbi:MAG: UbiD family decarboxylase [Candidatus Tectomicrobia bacterium]|nr:UbiD family decarboxylase [Candidatus Tectomicrobia bacterium]